jgi:hypothetical protein
MTKDEQIAQLQTQIDATRLMASAPINDTIAATFQLKLVDLERQMLELIKPE